MTGGSLGSLVAQAFHLTSAERKTLLVAGAAGGMSATFATPMAAVLLSVELLLFEWKPRSLIPVALASFTANLLRPFLLEPGPMFPVTPHAALPATWLLAAGVVGLLAGLPISDLLQARQRIVVEEDKRERFFGLRTPAGGMPPARAPRREPADDRRLLSCPPSVPHAPDCKRLHPRG